MAWWCWLIVTGAWAGVPFELPSEEPADPWTAPMALAGFEPGDLTDGAGVVAAADGAGWKLTVRDHDGAIQVVRVPAPRSGADREAVVWLADSLIRPIGALELPRDVAGPPAPTEAPPTPTPTPAPAPPTPAPAPPTPADPPARRVATVRANRPEPVSPPSTAIPAAIRNSEAPAGPADPVGRAAPVSPAASPVVRPSGGPEASVGPAGPLSAAPTPTRDAGSVPEEPATAAPVPPGRAGLAGGTSTGPEPASSAPGALPAAIVAPTAPAVARSVAAPEPVGEDPATLSGVVSMLSPEAGGPLPPRGRTMLLAAGGGALRAGLGPTSVLRVGLERELGPSSSAVLSVSAGLPRAPVVADGPRSISRLELDLGGAWTLPTDISPRLEGTVGLARIGFAADEGEARGSRVLPRASVAGAVHLPLGDAVGLRPRAVLARDLSGVRVFVGDEAVGRMAATTCGAELALVVALE